MTQAVSNFYLFINRKSRYQGDNGFTNLKLDMDTNRNNVIQFNELESFINANKSEMNLDNVTRNDVYSIWGELDLSIKGYNRMATGDVSENGSLNASEEQNLTEKIELYGMIDKAINKAKAALGNKLKLNGGYHDHKFNIDEDELYYRTADKMIKSNNIDVNTDAEVLQQLAEDALMSEASEIIKEQVLNGDTYRQALNGAGLNDYSLLGDNDLKEILTTEIKNMIEQGKSTEQISHQIACIARSYLKSAQITPQYTETYGITAWDNNNGLNQLQMERLRHEYKNAIKVEDINTDSKYNDFIDELNDAIDNFITKKLGEISATANFNTLFDNISDIKTEFIGSDEIKLLDNIVELNGVQDPSDLGIDPNHPNDTDWTNLYGSTNSNDSPNPQYILSMLHFVGGMSGDDLNKLIGSSTYTTYLSKAYKDILANPEKYNLNNLGDMKQIQEAVTKYFKDHLTEILKDIGLGSKETALALGNNYLGSLDRYYRNNTTVTYTSDDVIAAAKQFRDYVASTYQNNEYVMKEFQQEYSGYSLATGLESMSSADRKDAIEKVIDAIKAHPETNVTITENGEISGAPGDLDKITNPIGSGRKYGCSSSNNEDWGAIGDTVRCNGKNAIRSLIDNIYNELIKNKELDKDVLNAVRNNVREYYFAFIECLEFDGENGDRNDTANLSFEYIYTDKNGVKTKENQSTSYTYCTQKGYEKAKNNAITSSSGVYFLENRKGLYNDGIIAFDKSKVWEKFKEFYDRYVG